MWKNKAVRFSIIGVLALLVVVYFVMVLITKDSYFPNTTINGQDYGFKKPDYVDNVLYKAPASYELEIITRDGVEKINGNDVGLKVDNKTDLLKIKESQNPFAWFLHLGNDDYKYEPVVTYDDALVEKTVAQLDALNEDNMRAPKNAIVSLNDDNEVVATDDDLGNTIEDAEKICDLVKAAVLAGDTELDLDAEGCYKEPEFGAESAKVKKCVEFCNRVAGLNIEYLYGTCGVKMEPFQLFGTLKINNRYDVSISKDKVRNVLEGFSRLHDTYGGTRTFKVHDRYNIDVDGKYYGWLLDVDTETDNLFGDLVHVRGTTRTPAFLSTAYYYDESGDDIGGTYAEVDLTKQMMYFFQDGRMLMYSDVVTGCVNAGHATPPGLFQVTYKQTPATLVGEDYESKVTYWMPFNGGIGFHDATWRGKFGDEIYVYSGSHGCVNMPYLSAQKLFGYIEQGMPVIVHN